MDFKFDRLDKNSDLRKKLLPYCRLKKGEIWEDPINGHRVACIDATSQIEIAKLMNGKKSILSIQDPPYNLVLFKERKVQEFIDWCRLWISNLDDILEENSAFYVWLGADQKNHFQPLPEFMFLMREFSNFKSRSFITMRNQRGYGTSKNWMSVRQECLYYTKGNPNFEVQYTQIPKILRGYYKEVKGSKVENLQRSKSNNIRASNVWVDIQQVFHLMKENVNGCYAQKPIKSIERIILASSKENDLIVDFFGHSGTTLIAAQKNRRTCFTCDIDPIFAEIMIRRLENFYKNSTEGWQTKNPF